MKHCYFLFFLIFCSPDILRANPGYSNIEFVENKGQWSGPFRYKAVTPNSDIYLERDGFTYVVGESQNFIKIDEYKHGSRTELPVLKYHAYKVIFEGASQTAEITGSKPQQHYYNYFLGNDAAKWQTGLHPYHTVDYKNIYNGVDVHIASEGGQLKYDFIIQPGAEVGKIRLKVEGANKIEVKDDNLLIHTSVGTAIEQKPYAYQVINGERKEIPCRYKVLGNIVTYNFPNGYDNTELLVIDPQVVFSTFTGSTSDNFGFTATYDNAGNFYAGGIVFGTGYPFTTGFFQVNFAGGGNADGNNQLIDAGISKFDPTGATMLYSTYLGGRESETPHSMVVDGAGNLIVAGRTYSNNFPRRSDSYDTSYNGSGDIFVTKFNASGTALIGSTYIGGTGEDGVNITPIYRIETSLKKNYGDDARSEVIIDNANNIYVAGPSSSTDFPLINGIANKGGQDGVVFKLNANLTTLIWSTCLGGAAADAAYVLTLDKDQSHLFVAGGTESSGLGLGAVYQPAQPGGIDGYIARFLNGGNYPLERFTYIGTPAYDQTYGIQIDFEDNVYTMGQTNGNFPVINAGYSNTGANQFVMKIDKDLTAPIFSTVFGSVNATEPNISPVAFLVDTCQHMYISGWGGPNIIGYPSSTAGMPVLLGTPAPTPLSANTDGSDFYFIVLAKNATALLFGAYFGDPSGDEHVDGGTSRFDKNGVIYQSICGGCGPGQSAMPTTAGSWATREKGPNCNLAALKIAFNFSAVDALAKASPDAAICLGESIQFQNSSTNATTYEWDFGDGSQANTQPAPQYTYGRVGKFRVRMIAVNPNACKTRDTTYLDISVDTNKIDAAFDITDIKACPPFSASFANKSRYSKTPGANNFTRFVWDFGDGQTFTGANPTPHVYATTGNYTVKLTMIDTTSCNSPVTINKEVSFAIDSVSAGLELPPLVCTKKGVAFINTSKKATKYLWKFGDGDTSTAITPTHIYDTTGTFTVKLYAYNPSFCKNVDSVSGIVTVRSGPKADFTHEPMVPETNIPTTFFNHSSNAVSYEWNFGDNTGSTEHTPLPHQYKRTGEYIACLMAKSAEGCADTICKRVATDVLPLADIPTAFTPNGDGNNDILYVVGAGIEAMNLKLFNRWGEKIFESNKQTDGWDGTYKGKQQEMDVYAFVLNITFIDGTTLYKKGNVTLIR